MTAGRRVAVYLFITGVTIVIVYGLALVAGRNAA